MLLFFHSVLMLLYLPRLSLEEEHKSSLQILMSQLENLKIHESSLRREISRKNQQISTLQQQLEESTNNLKHSFRKLESLSEQCEKTIDQQTKIAVILPLTNT